ncbi:Transposase [Phytophthora megakarya]|uniref:Transposase n=1 Tax=Phytophthora megakarya TaxID=4795 RepID=A0A225V8X0_9STRA|nr:Transposase [Phytophthora megakarya]
MSIDGFLSWGFTTGMFTRHDFHKNFHDKILPFLNPWPLPRSILVLDNAKIHMYKELEEAVHCVGALLFFLPPYYPQLNPIEVGFLLLKRWIQRNATLAFSFAP